MNDKVNDTKVILGNIIDAMNAPASQTGIHDQLMRAIALYCNAQPRSSVFDDVYQEFKHYFQEFMMSGEISAIPPAEFILKLALIAHKYVIAYPEFELSIRLFQEKEIAAHVQQALSCYQILITHRDIVQHEYRAEIDSKTDSKIDSKTDSKTFSKTDSKTDSKPSSSSHIPSGYHLSADDLVPLLTILIEMGITDNQLDRPNLPRRFLQTYGSALQFQSHENETLRRLARLWLTMTYSPLTRSLGELDYAMTIISSCIYTLLGHFDRSILLTSDRISSDEIEFLKGIISHIAIAHRNNFKPIQQLSDNIVNNPMMTHEDKYQLFSHLLFCATRDESVLNKGMINSMLLGMRFISKDLLFFINLIQLREDINTSTKIDLCNYIIRFAKRDLSDRDNRSSNKSEYRVHQHHYQEAISIYKFYYFQNTLSITADRFTQLLQSLDIKNDAYSLEEKNIVKNIHKIFVKHAQAVLSALKAETINARFITNCLHDINLIIINHVTHLIPSYRQQNIKTILFKLTTMLDHVVYDDDAIDELERLIKFVAPEEFDHAQDSHTGHASPISPDNMRKSVSAMIYNSTESQDGSHGGINSNI